MHTGFRKKKKPNPIIYSMNGTDIITPLLRHWEQEHNRPARDILLDALNEHGAVKYTAKALMITPLTLASWVKLLGLTPTHVVKWK